MRNTKNKSFKIYDFSEEYGNSPDKVNHIIATDLTVEETIKKMEAAGIDINTLKPFIMLPLDYKDVFNDSFRNEKKHQQRQYLYGESYGYKEGIFELHHKEYANRLDYIEEIFEYEKQVRQEEIRRLDEAMKKLTEIQCRRLRMYYFDNLDFHQIAKKENRSRNAIRDSIRLALKKIQKFF